MNAANDSCFDSGFKKKMDVMMASSRVIHPAIRPSHGSITAITAITARLAGAQAVDTWTGVSPLGSKYSIPAVDQARIYGVLGTPLSRK